MNDIQCYDALMQEGLGYGLGEPPQLGSAGVQQTMLTTCSLTSTLAVWLSLIFFFSILSHYPLDVPSIPYFPRKARTTF